MHPLIEDYASARKIEIPLDYSELMDFALESTIKHFILDIRNLGKHHFFEFSFQFLNPQQNDSPATDKYAFANSYLVQEGDNEFVKVNDLFSAEIAESFGIEKSMTIGLNNTSGERDVGLYYLFDDDGKSQGLYASRFETLKSDGKIKIADQLEDFVAIPKLTTDIHNHDQLSTYNLKQPNRKFTPDDIAKKFEPFHALVSVDSGGVECFRALMNLLIEIGNGAFKPTSLEVKAKENTTSIIVIFALNKQEFEFSVDTAQDYFKNIYIIVEGVNGAIIDTSPRSSARSYFHTYFHPDRDTHYGVAYLDERQSRFLSKPSLCIETHGIKRFGLVR